MRVALGAYGGAYPELVAALSKAKLQTQASAIMTHPKLAVVLAAVLFAGSASAALAQGTGRAPTPGTGGGGTGFAPTPGIGTGAMPGTGITPTPGIGTGSPSNITPTPGSELPQSLRHTHRRPSEQRGSGREKAPSGGPARSLADIKEETEAGIVYQPCPANVRFPNGQQMCLGLPRGSRPYHTPRQR